MPPPHKATFDAGILIGFAFRPDRRFWPKKTDNWVCFARMMTPLLLLPSPKSHEGLTYVSDAHGKGQSLPRSSPEVLMEWIVEGVSLIFIGALVTVVTIINPNTLVSNAVYIVSVIGLIGLAVVALFTGFKVNFIPFKLCPFILTISAVLILLGALL